MSSRSNVNKVILIGNLGTNPELRYTAKGNPVVNLAVATNRSTKQADGEWKEQTEWHRAVVWGRRAETCNQYLEKGHRVFIEGTLQTRQWVDKDGQNHWNTEILVEDIKFLGGKKTNNNYGNSMSSINTTGFESSGIDEHIDNPKSEVSITM